MEISCTRTATPTCPLLPHNQPFLIRRHACSSAAAVASTYQNSFHYLLLPMRSRGSFACRWRSGINHRSPLPRLRFHDYRILCQGSKNQNSGHTPSGEGEGEEAKQEEEVPEKNYDSAAAMADEKCGLQGRSKSRGSINESDWRTFRARLVAGEQTSVVDPNQVSSGTSIPAITLGKSWAHPLHAPEAGCLLVATDKLDGQIDFERTVILLLRSGSNKPREGPFGVILNRPTSQTIKELDHENKTLANVFGNCEYFYGGPLESELLLLLQEGKVYKQFEEIIPGISHIAVDKLSNAARLMKGGVVKANDFRYFIGYSGWGLDQLVNEIEAGYWYVASCSATVLRITSSDKLWQKVLWLMGGHYAELSRKPRDSGLI